MSLLMQALKKAERAKQNHLNEDELAKPSEEFDAVLSLAPQDIATVPPPLLTEAVPAPLSMDAAPPRRVEPELRLEQYDNPALSLSPLPAEAEATASGARAGAGAGAGAALDMTPPAFVSAEAAALSPPAAAQTPPRQPRAAASADASRAESARAESAKAETPRPRARTAPSPKRRAAAPGRTMPDAATIRLAVLAGVALLVLCIFGFLYWRAVSGPGSGGGLPMVPMPPQTITPAGGAGLIVVAPPAPTEPTAPAGLPGSASSAGLAGLADPGAGTGMPATAPVSATAAGAAPTAAALAGDNPRGAPVAAPQLPPQALPPGPPTGTAANAMAAQMHPYPSGGDASAAKAAADSPRFNQSARSQQAAQPAQQATQQATQQQAPQQARQSARAERQQAVTTMNNGDIHMLRTDRPPQINPVLQNAYAAFSAGDTASAQRQYLLVQQQDPNNRDALLGLAAVALRQHQDSLAASQYLRLLELDPNDGEAAGGLIGLSHGDPAQSESRLNAILQRNPEAAPVLFTLGNLYAQQGRWSEAQQTYFRAWNSDPSNADYAFNVAVGLDRLNQPKLAISYYQRALALATNNPGTFDRVVAHRRLRELSTAAATPKP